MKWLKRWKSAREAAVDALHGAARRRLARMPYFPPKQMLGMVRGQHRGWRRDDAAMTYPSGAYVNNLTPAPAAELIYHDNFDLAPEILRHIINARVLSGSTSMEKVAAPFFGIITPAASRDGEAAKTRRCPALPALDACRRHAVDMPMKMKARRFNDNDVDASILFIWPRSRARIMMPTSHAPSPTRGRRRAS